MLTFLEQSDAFQVEPEDSDSPVDCTMLLAARPHRVGQSTVQQISAKDPLTQIVQVVGPWCSGELRTGNPVPGVVRMAWFEWPYRLPVALHTSRLPASASAIEQIQSSIQSIGRFAGEEDVLVIAENYADFSMVESACKTLGLTSLWNVRSPKRETYFARIAVLSATRKSATGPLEHAFSDAPSGPNLVCLGTPSLDDWTVLKELGTTAILHQPMRLEDLFHLLCGDFLVQPKCRV